MNALNFKLTSIESVDVLNKFRFPASECHGCDDILFDWSAAIFLLWSAQLHVAVWVQMITIEYLKLLSESFFLSGCFEVLIVYMCKCDSLTRFSISFC